MYFHKTLKHTQNKIFYNKNLLNYSFTSKRRKQGVHLYMLRIFECMICILEFEHFDKM